MDFHQIYFQQHYILQQESVMLQFLFQFNKVVSLSCDFIGVITIFILLFLQLTIKVEKIILLFLLL